MPSSRTALVLANRGDPIFGAIAKFLIKGGSKIVGGVKSIITGAKSTAVAVRAAGPVARGVGTVVSIAKSKPARVIASLGGVAGASAIGARIGTPGFPGSTIEGNLLIGPGGCPQGKVIDVAAHQRVIPLDRFGRPRRRINVLNTKALSRATRRLGGFQKRARRVEKQLARIAPRSRRRASSRKRCD